jgi:mono/diheme cytochrome c family protein
MRRSLLALATLALTIFPGCGASRFSREGGAIQPLTARAVEWNHAHADVGPVRAVADSGDTVVVFGDGQATILAGGAVVAVDRSVARWAAAGTLPAADGNGTWIIGVDAEGRVLRLRNGSAFEAVSDRWGLERQKVLGVAAIGPTTAGFLLAGELAVADGRQVIRYPIGPLQGLSGGGGRAALVGDPLRVFEPQQRTARAFALPEPAALAAMSAGGRLFAATRDAVYGEDDRGDLALRFEAPGATIHGLAAAGERVWFADGAELGTIEGGLVRETTGAKLAASARLVGSPSGDVWALSGDRDLLRFSADPGVAPGWDEAMAPVFQRSCAECHRSGGSAGVDLSTREAWTARREAIEARVVVDRSMPPAGHALADADREAIRLWLAPTP